MKYWSGMVRGVSAPQPGVKVMYCPAGTPMQTDLLGAVGCSVLRAFPLTVRKLEERALKSCQTTNLSAFPHSPQLSDRLFRCIAPAEREHWTAPGQKQLIIHLQTGVGPNQKPKCTLNGGDRKSEADNKGRWTTKDVLGTDLHSCTPPGQGLAFDFWLSRGCAAAAASVQSPKRNLVSLTQAWLHWYASTPIELDCHLIYILHLGCISLWNTTLSPTMPNVHMVSSFISICLSLGTVELGQVRHQLVGHLQVWL